MRMQQSIAEMEQAFATESKLDRDRRLRLANTANRRSLKRQVQRRNKAGQFRFIVLTVALIVTAIAVAIVMFKLLYIIMS